MTGRKERGEAEPEVEKEFRKGVTLIVSNYITISYAAASSPRDHHHHHQILDKRELCNKNLHKFI